MRLVLVTSERALSSLIVKIILSVLFLILVAYGFHIDVPGGVDPLQSIWPTVDKYLLAQ